MTAIEPRITEENLDPADWDALRKTAHRMVDDMLTYLQSVRERPAWRPIPSEHKAAFNASPLPLEPQDIDQVYEDYNNDVLSYPMGNIHPRFWAWVIGTGTPSAALYEMLAAGLNPNVGGGDHMANQVEKLVIEWCKEMLGYPAEASGLLVNGGSMANLTGLNVARNVKLLEAGIDVRTHGLTAAPRLRLYCSSETHSSVQRAAEVLGMGSESIHTIPVDSEFRIDLAALQAAINVDRDAGLLPFCVIGSAGTTNTGSIDDLNALADLCEREHLWYHVDGAIGAVAALSPAALPRLHGMERADSLAFDMHKWLHIPFEAGCILIRSREQHYNTFTLTPPYLVHSTRGTAGGDLWPSDYGIQLSRGFLALKVWMSLKEHGIRKLGRSIQQNIDQAQYLKALVEATPDLELLAPVALNIVCFRYAPSGMDDAALNALNEEILLQIQEQGIAVPSGTKLNGKYVLRVSITNHRTLREDFDLLVREVIRLGKTFAHSLPKQ